MQCTDWLFLHGESLERPLGPAAGALDQIAGELLEDIPANSGALLLFLSDVRLGAAGAS